MARIGTQLMSTPSCPNIRSPRFGWRTEVPTRKTGADADLDSAGNEPQRTPGRPHAYPRASVSAFALPSRSGHLPTLVRRLCTFGDHAVSPGGASSAPLASRDGTPANLREMRARSAAGRCCSRRNEIRLRLPHGASGRRPPRHARRARTSFPAFSWATLRREDRGVPGTARPGRHPSTLAGSGTTSSLIVLGDLIVG